MRTSLFLVTAIVFMTWSNLATAQGPPPPGYGPPPPGYGPPPPGPGYGPPPPGPGYGPPPPYRPPPPPPPKCCLWSVRYDPFDLLFRRVTFEGEVNVIGPITVQLSPAWIFDSPSENLSENGFDIGLDVVWYVQGDPFHGFWLKAHAEYEYFEATLTREVDGQASGRPHPDYCDADSEPGTCSTNVGSMIVGAMIGTGTVFGKNGGFAISGGIGIGVALADTVTLQVDGNAPNESGLMTTYYDKTDRIRLLGSLGLGVAF